MTTLLVADGLVPARIVAQRFENISLSIGTLLVRPMSMKRKAMAQPRAGALDELAVQTLDRREPERDEVEVRVVASALNPADLKVARGDLVGRFLHARVSPLVVGYDYAGTVERRGEGVTHVRPGDRVFGFLPYAGATSAGTFTEYVVVSGALVERLPEGVTHEVAAAAATPGITALQGLRDHGRLERGQRVLIIGASGGVGSIAIGVAKRLGAHVTAVCGAHAIELVRELGADEAIDRAQQDPREIRATFDVILDAAAAYGYASLRRQLAPRGAYVTTLPGAGVIGGSLLALFSGRRCRFITVKPVRADLALLASWLADGLRAPVDSEFPVRDLARAFERLGRGAMRGRIVVNVERGF